MTRLEKKIYETAKKHTLDDYSTDVERLAKDTGLELATVKGVVGSLVKKGLMEAEKDERDGIIFYDLFPVVDGEIWSYAWENGLAD